MVLYKCYSVLFQSLNAVDMFIEHNYNSYISRLNRDLDLNRVMRYGEDEHYRLTQIIALQCDTVEKLEETRKLSVKVLV